VQYKCLKCNHVWSSGLAHSPKQCPSCKRKDWDGLHNSSGKLLAVPVAAVPAGGVTCGRCGSSWSSGKAGVTACPFCGAAVGGAVPVAVGGAVTGAAVTPSAVAVDPFDPDGMFDSGRCNCRKCGNSWLPRVPNPAQCPKCKSRDWSEAASAAALDSLVNPVWRDCDRRHVMTLIGPLGDENGIHRFIDSAKTGLCPKCGWNNNTGVQVGIDNPQQPGGDAAEQIKREWELKHGKRW